MEWNGMEYLDILGHELSLAQDGAREHDLLLAVLLAELLDELQLRVELVDLLLVHLDEPLLLVREQLGLS